MAAEAVLTDRAACEASKTLHPTSCTEVDENEVTKVRDVHGDRISEFVANGGDEEEIIRILLAMQHNGFSSGLYTELAIFNHSCDPNVIKFSTESSKSGASECWTTRPVAAGEELTIHYCAPGEATRATTQAYLKAQHNFECKCTVCESPVEEDASVAQSFEKWLDEVHHISCP